MNRLDGKVALISGGAKGIGAATAHLMAQAGARVVIGDVLADEGEETAGKIGEAAEFTRLDVTKETAWQHAAALAVERFGRLDVLVNNAGYFLGKSIEDATLEEWNAMSAINMTGVFLGTKHCADALREAGRESPHGSSIVNLSSIAGLVGAPLDPLYSMTKGGVTLFTKSQAVVFASRGDRIRVNAVHPGVIDTEMGQKTIDVRAASKKGDRASAAREAEVRHPMGRLGTVDDIAKAIVFLASDDSGFMTGSSMVVDGGLTAI
ncbi:MAG: glucose 1-dehydrogenase [Pseudomonadota bacterium]